MEKKLNGKQYLNYNFRLHCSNLCNQKCDYCHIFRGEEKTNYKSKLMNTDVAKTAIDSIALLVQDIKAGIQISFYGGEPLLNWKVVKETLKYGNRIFTGAKQVNWILNTNGTLLTPNKVTLLKQENVDIHLSIDGPDNFSNQHRKFKNGRSVLNKIKKSLEILKEYNLSFQFDTCLTSANLHSLKELIDLAAEFGANRIYLALIDYPHPLFEHEFSVETEVRKVIEAMKYGEKNGVVLGGPWKRAIYGQQNQRHYLIINPLGQVSFPAYHKRRSLGYVTDLKDILISEDYKKTIKKWETERATCQGCDLEIPCKGYLKGMVMYHTGTSKGHEKECKFAGGILDKFIKDIDEQKLTISRNLILKESTENEKIIINRLAGTAVKASPDFLKSLTVFNSGPVHLLSLSEQYSRLGLWNAVMYLMNINFLIPNHMSEDVQCLKKMIDLKNIKFFETRHFLTYYPDGVDYPARNFSDFMEDVYRFLTNKGFSYVNNKILIFICRDREEFKRFWGSAPLPEWPKAFVFSNMILVIDQQKIKHIELKNIGFFQGMAHELVHIFLGQLYCQIPVWLEEGLCEYFSKSDSNDKFIELNRQKKIFGFQEIEIFAKNSLLDLDDSPVKENICYRQSHSFIKYLANLKGEKILLECVKSTGLDCDFRTQFFKFYGQSLENAEKYWQGAHPEIRITKLKASENLRVIKNYNNTLLYNAFYGQSLKANSDIIFLIDSINHGMTLGEIAEEYDLSGLLHVITQLYKKGLIIFDNQIEDNKIYRKFTSAQVEKGTLVNKLRLNISNLCNMSCNYCYVDQAQKEQMDWPIAQKALDSFFKLQKQTNHTHTLIRFFGGEPLLNWFVIEHTFEYVNSIKQEIKVDYLLNTNGTIVTEKIAKKLGSNQVNIAVSLDGIGTDHDRYRKFKSGKGSFSTIDKNMDMLLSSGCIVGIGTTVGDHNCNRLKQLIDYIADKEKKYNCRILLSLQSMCMVPKDDLDTISLKEKIKLIMEAISYAGDKGINIDEGMIMFPFNVLLGKRNTGVYCRAMGEEICVYPNGDIYPCGALKTKMGNIGNLRAVFKSNEYLNLINRVAGNIPGCNGCDIEAFCAGGCAADAAIKGNNIFLPTQNCQFEKLAFKALVNEFILGNV